jgi:hypothetical protein
MTARQSARFKVLSEAVYLCDGVSLPKGNYAGFIETEVVYRHGHRVEQVGRAVVRLPQTALDKLKTSGSTLILPEEVDLSSYLATGDVRLN